MGETLASGRESRTAAHPGRAGRALRVVGAAPALLEVRVVFEGATTGAGFRPLRVSLLLVPAEDPAAAAGRGWGDGKARAVVAPAALSRGRMGWWAAEVNTTCLRSGEVGVTFVVEAERGDAFEHHFTLPHHITTAVLPRLRTSHWLSTTACSNLV